MKGSEFQADRIGLVQTLRDLNSLELDSSKRPPELEFLRIFLRQKLPPGILVMHDKLIAEGKGASHHVLRMHARSARARLPWRGAQNDWLECSSNVHTLAHFCMVDRQAISHIKAMRDQRARINFQRVFCIDSNPYFRDFVCWFLSDIGCEVAAAATGGEALSLVRQKPSGYDLLVVADWLPDMDGVELLPTLRSIHYAGRIAVTAPQLSPEQRSTYESLGASSILITPVGYCELMRILEPVVATSSASRDQRDDSAYGQAPPSFAR